METFGFKSRKFYGLLELKYVTLLMFLIPCAWTQDNIPSFNVTCDSNGLHVKIAFSKPFSGTVYAKGYRFDPVCSKTESSVFDGSLFLPITACGTYVQETNDPWITNTVVVQQHPLIKTINDLEKSIICLPPHPFENVWNSSLLIDQIYESHFLPLSQPSLDIQMGYKDSAAIFDSNSTRFAVFQLRNGTIYKDFGIKSCIAHNSKALAGNVSVHQITHPEGCFNIDSKSSSLTIIGNDEGLTAYVEMKSLEIEYSDSFYLTCEVILCRTKCNCSEIDQQEMEHSTSVISHKLIKRSTDTSSEMSSLKQYEARTRFLKSTVKALMDRIMEQGTQQNGKSKIRKRLMRLDDSLSETNPFGSDITPPELVSPEFDNVVPHLVNIYGDYDPDNSRHDYDTEDSHHDFDLDDSDHDYNPEDSHHDHEDEPSSTTEFSTFVSGIDNATMPKEYEDNGSKIDSDEKLQGKDGTVSSVGLPTNEDTGNMKTAVSTAISVFPPVVGVSSDHLDSCVPRLRFVIVIVILGFVIGCLIMVACGMGLYIRKERRRNKLNDFLLYSIGF